MYKQTKKKNDSDRNAIPDAVYQRNASNKPTFGFADNRSEFIAQRKIQLMMNPAPAEPVQLMKEWTQTGGFKNITTAPADGLDKSKWLRCKYKGEEIYISSDDMAQFSPEDWDHIEYYEEDDLEAEDVAEKPKVDEFPDHKVGEVTSITKIKESRSDHQYVIVMVKGGGNLKMHYGTGGALYEKSDDIDNEHGITVGTYKVPKGLTGARVTEIFESTKDAIAEKFTGGNCGILAAELIGKIGGEPED